MLSAALGFAAGVGWLQTRAELPSWAWLVAACLVGLMLAWVAPRPGGKVPGSRKAPGSILRLAGWTLLGVAWSGASAQVKMADRLDPLLEGRDVELTGVVASLPQPIERGVRFRFDVDAPASGVPRRLLLAWYNGLAPEAFQDIAPLRAGERWRFTVRLRRPHGLANPHGFDYEAWLLEQGIRATGYVRPGGARRLEALVSRPGYLVERLREGLRERFWDALGDAPYAGVLIALAIGEQQAIDPAQWQVFASTGISHLMSISGLHVTMLAGLAAWLTLWLWRRSEYLALRLPAQKAAAVGGFLGALAYCLVSGFAVPAQRTLDMVGIVALAFWFDRASAPSRVLAVALLLVLLLDPWAVLAPGFWLSFAAVALIFYVTLSRPKPEGWLWQWGRVQGAMTLGLAPLTLVLFQQVSLVSPLANAIAIPVVSFVVTPLALMGAVLPWDLPLTLAHGTLSLLMQAMAPLAALDGAVWHQHAPVTWTLLPALAGVLWLLAPRGVPGRVLGIVLMLPLFAVVPPAVKPGEARLDVLDVGQGTAVVVRTRNHALLYDAGPAWGLRGEAGTDSGARVVVPFLRGEGVNALDVLMISHDDNDHAGGGASVVRAYPGAWLMSSLASDHPLQSLARGNASCAAGFSWQWDGVRFVVLHPARAQSANPYTALNDRSCVLRIESGKVAALLAGDIGHRGEAALLERREQVRADVLLVPHHGSATSSSPAFVEAVAPRHAVFSVGYRNRFGHPREDVVARYREKQSLLLRTDERGALGFALQDEGVTSTAFRSASPRYWRTD